MECCVRPLDSCCPCFLIEHPTLDSKECICSCCEPVRRLLDFRLAWKRPFVCCVLFGVSLGLVPVVVIVAALLSGYLTILQVDTRTTNCSFAVGWGILEAIFCIINFLYTYWLFNELKRPEEERDFLFSRDMSELYNRYLVYNYPHIITQMRSLNKSYLDAKKEIVDERNAANKELELLKTQFSDLQIEGALSKDVSIHEKKAALTKKINNLEKFILKTESNSDASLLDKLTTIVTTDRNCAFFLTSMISSFGWTICGSMFLKGSACSNPLILLACRLLLYSVYVFVIMGVGNIFSASEISYRSAGIRMDLSEAESLMELPETQELHEDVENTV